MAKTKRLGAGTRASLHSASWAYVMRDVFIGMDLSVVNRTLTFAVRVHQTSITSVGVGGEGLPIVYRVADGWRG